MITRAGKLTVKTENRTDKSLFKFRCWHRILKDVAISHENVFKFKNASEGEGMYEHVKRKKKKCRQENFKCSIVDISKKGFDNEREKNNESKRCRHVNDMLSFVFFLSFSQQVPFSISSPSDKHVSIA